MSEVRVIYKSGAEVQFTCEKFAVVRNGLGDIVSVKWERATPEPMHFGLDEVAAIWQLG
jgi:hypothetical protein